MNQTTDSVRSQQSGPKRTVTNRRTKLIFLVLLIFVVLSGIYLAGNIISDDLIVADFSQKGLKPSWKHPFGTDMLGRDMLSV